MYTRAYIAPWEQHLIKTHLRYDIYYTYMYVKLNIMLSFDICGGARLFTNILLYPIYM